MKILAIEASALTASVAITEDDLLKGEFTVNNKLTHSETLLPMLESMAEISGISLEDVDAIAVSAGPGSFTGLRIGAATAKGLALAYNCPVIKVPTLAAMAYTLSLVSDSVICPIMDARRGQVYSAAYCSDAVVLEEDARDIHYLISRLNETVPEEERSYIFLGDGVPVYSDIISAELEGDVSFAGADINRQRAAGVAVLGSVFYNKWLVRNGLTAEAVRSAGADAISCFDDTVMNSDNLAPEYLRKSQAEREMEQGVLEDPGQHSLKKMQSGGPRRGKSES